MQFHSRIITPPSDSAGLVNTFYIIETAEERREEAVPAYSAQLVVTVRGKSQFTYADGSSAQAPAIFINAPLMRSALCRLEGPVLQVGASLTHVSWQKLSNLPADQIHDRLIPAADILAPDRLAALEQAAADCRDGLIAPEDLCVPLAAAIGAGRHAQRAEHVAAVEAMLRWLASGFDPALDDLYAKVDMSPRQLQRISRRYFGVPPAQVLKRFRALRAAMLLTQPGLSPALHDELMATYFDQAHLIRDIRRYTGRTPTQFRQESLVRGLLDPAAHGDAGAPLNPAEEKERPARPIDG